MMALTPTHESADQLQHDMLEVMLNATPNELRDQMTAAHAFWEAILKRDGLEAGKPGNTYGWDQLGELLLGMRLVTLKHCAMAGLLLYWETQRRQEAGT